MKQKLHRLITVVLALSVVGLIFSQRQVQVSTAEELDMLHSTVSILMQRLDSNAATTKLPYAQIGDRVRVNGLPETLQGDFIVDVGGALLLPDLGRVHVAGLTAKEIQILVAKKAQLFFVDVDLQVAIYRYDQVPLLQESQGVLFSAF